MKNLKRKNVILGVLTSVVLAGLVIAVLHAGSYIKEQDNYVEVGGGKIAYVPRTAKFVKVNGQVRRIVRFAATLSKEEKDCACPKCCDGSCYVIIFTDGVSGTNLIVPMYVFWVSCT